MTSPRRCSGCGALPARSSSRFCDACGAELPSAEGARPPSASRPDAQAILDRLERHPDLSALLARDPRAIEGPLGTRFGTLVFAALTLVTGTFLSFLAGILFPPLIFLPVAGTLVVLYLALTQLARQPSKEPLEARPALVVGYESGVRSGGEEAGRVSVSVALELPGGSRVSTALPEGVAAPAAGTAGVAYLQGGSLIAFSPLEPS